jgi:predicted NBD/HSP70 family sugar kinase
LAPALGDAINVLNTSLIVLGGFLAAIQQRDAGYLDDLVRAHSLTAAHEDVTITRAALGSDLLMIGAAELTFAALLADPAAHAR